MKPGEHILKRNSVTSLFDSVREGILSSGLSLFKQGSKLGEGVHNRERLHSSLGYETPEVWRALAAIARDFSC